MESDRPGVRDSECVTSHERLPGCLLHSPKAEEKKYKATRKFNDFKTDSQMKSD